MKLVIIYLLWALPASIITYFQCREIKLENNLPVYACFIWGPIVTIDYYLTWKEKLRHD